MENLTCKVCGKTFLGHNDHSGEITACDECRKTVLDELSDGKGEEDDE